MKSASLPANEAERLKALNRYEILHTLPEQVFDDLTTLATHVCQAPIALISLVSEQEQWFKSKVGTSMNETSRDIAFCAHAILQKDIFIVPDATKDDRFADNPLVTDDPNIRFYAGAPLITPDGFALGTFCVVDREPRELTDEQKETLKVLSRHVISQLELWRQSRAVISERNQMESALRAAQAELAKVSAALGQLQVTVTESLQGKM